MASVDIKQVPAAMWATVPFLGPLVMVVDEQPKVRSSITRTNNAFYGNGKNVESNADTTTLGDGSGAKTDDPLLAADYRPSSASPLFRAGAHLGYMLDAAGRLRNNPPTIGAYEAPA